MPDYYAIKTMDVPTPEMYHVTPEMKVLIVGTARKQSWATTVDIDPNAPADIIANGVSLPFADQEFDLAILDFVTNFCHPHEVTLIIKEANRVARMVRGRCHVSSKPKTLRGPKQAYCHAYAPHGVDWIEVRHHA